MIASSAAFRSSLVIQTPEVEDLEEVKEGKDTNEPALRAPGAFPLLPLPPQLPLPHLLVFLIDVPHCAVLVEHRIEHFMLSQHDFAELFFLEHRDGLHLYHFQHREERYDHGVARWAGLEEADEVHGVVVAGQDLRAELRH